MRQEPSMVRIERRGFIELTKIADKNWDSLDVFRTPEFQSSLLDQYDAFMIGGISDDPRNSVEMPEAEFPWINNLYALMQYAIEIKKPGLLSCGGFMLASMMLGAEIVIDPDQKEMGTYTLNLSDFALEDPLFSGFPRQFEAVSGHMKSTKTLPPDCELLVSSERCPIHGFKVKEAPFYAFQFHPEIQSKDLKDRISLYKEKYFETEAEYQEFISAMTDTTIANRIITRFLKMVSNSQ